jgi:carbamoyl-phosphate synthase large subunit
LRCAGDGIKQSEFRTMSSPASTSNTLTLLISCVGRRVELVQAFRAAARRLNVSLRVIATDRSATAPAFACADVAEIAPSIDAPGYVPHLLDLARRFQAGALIPTIDTDLPVLAANRAAFEQIGCTPLIGGPDIIRICRDKIETHRFLRDAGIDTPDTHLPDELGGLQALRFPYIVKPRFGSASQQVHKIDDRADLDYYLRKGDQPIVQEFVNGVEHTLDVYVGLTGQPRCVVPRRRWQTRGGEVSKGVVVKDREIMDAGRHVVERLGSSLRGLVTLQCIVTQERRIRFIEINPRFGGGAPLGIAAGADYPGWLIQELLGRSPSIAFDGFRHGLCMSRYDWSVFLPLGDDLAQMPATPLRPYPPFE